MRQMILHLTDKLAGGVATFMVGTLPLLQEQGDYDLQVWSLQHAEDSAAERLRQSGIAVTALNAGRYDPRPLGALQRHCRQHEVALLHAHLDGSSILAGLLKRRGYVPRLVCHLHSPIRGWPWRPLIGAALREADACIAVSNGTLRAAQRAYGAEADRAEVVYNGIDTAVFAGGSIADARVRLGHTEERITVVFVGRLDPGKNVHVLLEAMTVAREQDQRLELVLVGDGALGEALRRQAAEGVAAGVVRFMGRRNDVPALLPGFDIFVLPSRWEGLPLAILEAMACGLPVVGTEVGGVPEVVAHGETGLLVAPGDPEALAAAVVELAADPGRRRSMGEAGRRRVEEHFTLEKTAEGVGEVYRRVLGGDS